VRAVFEAARFSMWSADLLSVTRFAPVDPDTINHEIRGPGGEFIADLAWGFDGSKSILLANGAEQEIEATGLIALLHRCAAELDDWAADLRSPGGAWDPKNPYYAGDAGVE